MWEGIIEWYKRHAMGNELMGTRIFFTVYYNKQSTMGV